MMASSPRYSIRRVTSKALNSSPVPVLGMRSIQGGKPNNLAQELAQVLSVRVGDLGFPIVVAQAVHQVHIGLVHTVRHDAGEMTVV